MRLVLMLAVIPLLMLAPLAGADTSVPDLEVAEAHIADDHVGYPGIDEVPEGDVCEWNQLLVDVSGTWVDFTPRVTADRDLFGTLSDEHTAAADLVLAARD